MERYNEYKYYDSIFVKFIILLLKKDIASSYRAFTLDWIPVTLIISFNVCVNKTVCKFCPYHIITKQIFVCYFFPIWAWTSVEKVITWYEIQRIWCLILIDLLILIGFLILSSKDEILYLLLLINLSTTEIKKFSIWPYSTFPGIPQTIKLFAFNLLYIFMSSSFCVKRTSSSNPVW